jgi:gluconolactonase
MGIHYDISRRHMLAMTAAGLAVSRVGAASAQAVKRIEQFDPALEKLISTTEPIKELATGLGGPLGPAEGPVWIKEGGYLLFSDINASRRMKYTPGQGVTVFQEKTNQANGLTRDLQGRLIACEHETRRVTRQERDGSITVVANSFQGRRLNRPNDVVVKSDGSIYFTDPNGNFVPEQWDLTFAGVFRVSADLGTMTLLADNFVQPNGLAFSPDESVLYIIDSRRNQIRAFDVLPNGMLAKQTDRLFADLRGSEPGNADGMKVDIEGNIYTGGAGGIYVIDPKGKKLGRTRICKEPKAQILEVEPVREGLVVGSYKFRATTFACRGKGSKPERRRCGASRSKRCGPAGRKGDGRIALPAGMQMTVATKAD